MDADFPPDLLTSAAACLDEAATLPCGQDVYPHVFASTAFFPLQRPRELAAMMQRARTIGPRIIYEIGADKGGGLFHWIKCLPTVKRVIACEIRGTPYASLFEKAFPGVHFLWLEASSYETATVARVKRWLEGTKIDCLFIDGDKSAFQTDFDCYRPCVSDRGVVFLHDVQDEAPGEAFRALALRGYRHEQILDLSDTREALIRERAGMPAAHAHESWLRLWAGKSCSVGVLWMEDDHR